MSHSAGTRIAVVCLLLGVASLLYASPVGSITGTLKDPSGAVVPNAHLTLSNKATDVKVSLTSDGNGNYTFLQLTPAVYTLTAEATGFKKATVGTVIVEVDQVTHVDLTLQVGSMSETVEVSAAAPLLEMDKTTLSSVVESSTIAVMPLNARQYLDLALLTPGALPSATGTQGGGFNVSGARSQSNVFLLDGVSTIDTQVNSALGNFRITDAVQEFAVQTSVATAEFGRGTGGQVSVVTKSGSNALHGSVFEYFRNSNMDAADFFTNKNNGIKNPLHRNQFGATVGGPIVHDKTFFFASWEDFRQVAPQVSTTRVPTAAERATVTDPISKALLQFWPNPNTTISGSANNFIANVGSTTFDHTGLLKIDHNFSERDHLTGRWVEYEGSTFTPGALPLLDGNANAPISRSGVVTETHTFSPKILNEFRFGFSRNQTFITVQDSGFDASKIFVDSSGKPLAGIVNGSTNLLDSGLPTIGVSGGFASLGSTSNLPQGRITNTYELFDNLSIIAPFGASKHSFRMGIHIRREDARRFLDGSARGVFNFASFSDFASGLVNTSSLLYGSTLDYWQRYPLDAYWQDTYKARDNLTLNYGLRYEYPSAIAETRAQATNFIPGVGPVLLGTNQVLTIDTTKVGPASLTFKQAPNTISNTGVNKDNNNFAPVLGMAYTPRFSSIFGHDDTVIRAGFRVGFDDLFNNIPANMGLNAPYNLTTAQAAGTTQPGKFSYATALNQNVPLVKFVNGVPSVGLISISAEDPNIRSAYLYQYNFGIQRRIHGDFSLEVDYQGSTGHKLGLFIDQNQPTLLANGTKVFPYPTFGSIGTGVDIGNSNYNSMVVTTKYQHRGVFVQGSYTYGKSIDEGSAFFGSSGEQAGVADGNHINFDRGPSSFDIRQRAVVNYVIDMPFGPGHRFLGWNNGFNRQIFGGWQVAGITTLQGGAPFTVVNTSQDFSGFNQFHDRPDVVGTGQLIQNNRNPDSAFDTTYFGVVGGKVVNPPPFGRVGSSGRNQYYGPGIANYNFTALKTFSLTPERLKLSFAADFFNVFNHTNFSNPVASQSNANFGKITSTLGSGTATAVGTTAGVVGGGPRVTQLSLRLTF
jgi:hypothetical protein